LAASIRFQVSQNWQRTVSFLIVAVSVSIDSPLLVSFPR
jgi:hypothetical protein